MKHNSSSLPACQTASPVGIKRLCAVWACLRNPFSAGCSHLDAQGSHPRGSKYDDAYHIGAMSFLATFSICMTALSKTLRQKSRIPFEVSEAQNLEVVGLCLSGRSVWLLSDSDLSFVREQVKPTKPVWHVKHGGKDMCGVKIHCKTWALKPDGTLD
eukprot:1582554-Amphidinium_carterae.1